MYLLVEDETTTEGISSVTQKCRLPIRFSTLVTMDNHKQIQPFIEIDYLLKTLMSIVRLLSGSPHTSCQNRNSLCVLTLFSFEIWRRTKSLSRQLAPPQFVVRMLAWRQNDTSPNTVLFWLPLPSVKLEAHMHDSFKHFTFILPQHDQELGTSSRFPQKAERSVHNFFARCSGTHRSQQDISL